MAEAWSRLMQRTCQQAEELGDVDNDSELTMEMLYDLRKEAEVNAKRARSKLDEFLRARQPYR